MGVTDVLKRSSFLMAACLAAALISTGALVAVTPDQAQASSTKKVWVVTKAVHKNGLIQDPTNWSEVYKYNDAGLITKAGFVSYSYDKKYRFKAEKMFGERYTFKYDKKGRVSDIKNANAKYVYNSKGYLKQYKSGLSQNYKYDSKGRLTRITGQGDQADIDNRFVYDSKNHVKSYYMSEYEMQLKIKNTYKGSRLTKQQIADSEGNTETVIYKYKKVSVPSKAVKMVKAQQKWVFIDNLPDSYSPSLLGIYK